ncbi:MAG TPA: hypothetical protein VLC98_01025 [Phnomibacter sp.]|nr:hypothetical protein [Phnomibacter sp.]
MRYLLLICIWALSSMHGRAQKPAARYEIDAKRLGVSPTDKDALPRGREFIRLDSTYYVGWMYQGLYLHDRSVDITGYQRALPLLRKAFLLMEKDYSGLLSTLYNDPMVYMQNNIRYTDYLTLARSLREGYEYTETPDSAMWVLGIVERKNFKRDFLTIHGSQAWIIHRNRFYTSKDYAFLGNSVEENEQRALQACYNGFAFIKKNAPQNNLWFGEMQSDFDRQYIYHYLALIHCYLKNYDSSNYYYQKMAQAGTISWNNYGSMKAEIGEFGEAIELYNRDKFKYGGVKALMEPYYYLPMLSIYSGKPKDAMDLAKEAIQFSNSSPGFGWYNLALARGYLYDGQLDSAWHTIEKAAAFKEVHIGTTLTQPQYDFTVGLLKLVWFTKKLELTKFMHKNWWYHPRWLYEVAALQAQKYTHEYVLASQLALNPERARIIYDLFCGESTVSYDEVYYVMERFSPVYFTNLMQNYVQQDPREKIIPYFKLFEAKLLWHDGSYAKSSEILNDLINNTRVDSAHQKLFTSRLYEGLWREAVRTKDTDKALQFQQLMFNNFPNLIPFSSLPFTMQLEQKGYSDANTRQIISELKNCNIQFSNQSHIPRAVVSFARKGSKYEALINMYDANDIPKFQDRFLFSHPDRVAEEIALRMFGKKGALEIEQPKQVVEAGK